MDVKGKVLLQLFNKSKLRNGIKAFVESYFFSIVKFKKLGFSAPLIWGGLKLFHIKEWVNTPRLIIRLFKISLRLFAIRVMLVFISLSELIWSNLSFLFVTTGFD